MKRRVDKVYTAADHIVAVSDTYAQRAMMVNKKCSKPTIVYLGTEASVFEENIKDLFQRNIVFANDEVDRISDADGDINGDCNA